MKNQAFVILKDFTKPDYLLCVMKSLNLAIFKTQTDQLKQLIIKGFINIHNGNLSCIL